LVVAFNVVRAAFDRPVPTKLRPGSHVTTTRPSVSVALVTPNQTLTSGLRRKRRVGTTGPPAAVSRNARRASADSGER
jgi:hypothetical protein